MSLSFTAQDFDDYSYSADAMKTPGFQNFLKTCKFQDSKDTLTILSCGGTISSAYSFAKESIRATSQSPVTDVLKDLQTSFGLAPKNIETLPLLDKDSRDITKDDIKFVLDVINFIKSERIVVTCGTYGLPIITQIIGKHVQPSNKVVVVTGSMLISSMREHDVDFNAGGAISLANGLHKFRDGGNNKPVVCACFHGGVYTSEECAKLDLHPEDFSKVEFYRGQRIE